MLHKPNSVVPVTWLCESFLWDQRCRWPRATYPETDSSLHPEVSTSKAGRAARISSPYLVLLRMGFTVPRSVAGRAVRSYRTLSPLPGLAGRSTLCGTFRRVTAPRR